MRRFCSVSVAWMPLMAWLLSFDAGADPSIPSGVERIAKWMEQHRPAPAAARQIGLYVQLLSVVEGHPIDFVLRGDGTNWSPTFARIDWQRDTPPPREPFGGRFWFGPDGTIRDLYVEFDHPTDAAGLRMTADSLEGDLTVMQRPVRRSEMGTHGIMTDNRYTPKPLRISVRMKKTRDRLEGLYSFLNDTNRTGRCLAYVAGANDSDAALCRMHLHNALIPRPVAAVKETNAVDKADAIAAAKAKNAMSRIATSDSASASAEAAATVSNVLAQADEAADDTAKPALPDPNSAGSLHMEALVGPWGAIPIRAYAPKWDGHVPKQPNQFCHTLDTSALVCSNGHISGAFTVRLLSKNGAARPGDSAVTVTVSVAANAAEPTLAGFFAVPDVQTAVFAATGSVTGTVVPIVESASFMRRPPVPPAAPADANDPAYLRGACEYAAACLRTARAWLSASGRDGDLSLWAPATWTPGCAIAPDAAAASVTQVGALLESWDGSARFATGRVFPEDPAFGPYYIETAIPGWSKDPKGDSPPPETGLGKWITLTNWLVLGPLPLLPAMPGHATVPPIVTPISPGAYDCPDPRLPPGGFAARSWLPAQFKQEAFPSMEIAGNHTAFAHPWMAPPNWKTDSDRFDCRYYAYAEIRAPTPIAAHLALRTESLRLNRGEQGRSRCRAWLNNRPLWDSDHAEDDLFENAAILPVKLSEGANALLLEVSSDRHVTQKTKLVTINRDGLGFRCHLNTNGVPRAASVVREIEAARRKMLAEKPLPEVIGFRGNMQGVYKDATPPIAWDLKENVNVLWRVALTNYSNASPLVIGDRVLTTCEGGYLFCYDKMTGKFLWQGYLGSVPAPDGKGEKAVPVRRGGWEPCMGNMYATPVSDGERIWAKCANGVLACFDLNGNRLWAAHEEKGGGQCPSPVLCGNHVVQVWHYGRPRHPTVVALDKATGKEVWRTPLRFWHNSDDGNSIPVRLSNGRETMDVLVTEHGCLLRAEDGAVLRDDIGLRCSGGSTAVTVIDDLIVYPDQHAQMTAVRLAMLDRDTIAVLPAWKPTWWPGGSWHFYTGDFAVHRNGFVYLATLGFEHYLKHPVGWQILNVVDASSGALVKRIKPCIELSGYGYTPTTIAGRYLFIGDSAGHGGICADSRAGGKDAASLIAVYDTELGHMVASSLMRRIQAPPAFDKDRMYLRTHEELVCIAKTGPAGESCEREAAIRQLVRDLDRRELLPATETTLVIPAAATTAPDDCPAVSLDNVDAAPRFIVAGPFDVSSPSGLDAAAESALRPRRGMKIADKPFGDFDPALQLDTRSWREASIDYIEFLGRRKGAYAYWASTLRVDSRTMRRFQTKGTTAVYLSGQRIKDGQLIRLDPGFHPLLLRVDLSVVPPKGFTFVVSAQLVFRAVPAPDQRLADWVANAAPFRKRIEWALEQVGGKGPHAASLRGALDRLDRVSAGR